MLSYYIDGRAEESDQTGDSGMGSGSGTTKYGSIKEWKEAIQNPPPGISIIAVYTVFCKF